MTNALLRWWGNLETQTRWLCMLYGPWLLGLFICLGNHFSFVALHDQDASQYDKTVIAALKNVWPLAVRGCMVASATTAFVPILWSSLPGKPLSVEVVDSALQLPALAPALRIITNGSLRDLLVPILATLNVLTYAIITIAPPAALVERPMYSKLTQLTVPRPDFSRNSTHFAMVHGNWSYHRPDAYLMDSVQDILKLRKLGPWDPPADCGFNCSYRISYKSPIIDCTDYTPEEQLNSSSTTYNKTYYRARFTMNDDYPMLDIAVWPTQGGAPMNNGLNWTASPIGTRCAFYQGLQTANVTFQGTQHEASILWWNITSHTPITGTSLGLLNTSSCPLDSNPANVTLLDVPSCANTRIQLNTWAFIDAFAGPLVGEIHEAPDSSTGFDVLSKNSMLLLSLAGIFFCEEHYAAFYYNPIGDDGKLRRLSDSLESIFAKSTLLLTHYAQSARLNEVVPAYAQPFASRYVYTPRFLWWAYAAALITVVVPCLLACFYIGKGFVLTDETTLSRVLAATRGARFDIVKGMSNETINRMVIRYEQVQARNEWEDGMGFSVVLKGEERDPKGPDMLEERTHLLSKA